MKKIAFLFLIYLLTACIEVAAANATMLFEKANRLYREKKYAEAAELYEQMIASGIKSGAVYYNLGNSAYKKGQLSRAILNYERAKRLNPADENIQFNLKLAYSATTDKIEPIPLLFYQRWWQQFLYVLSASGWAMAAVTGFWLALASGVLYLTAGSVTRKRNAFLLMTGFFVVSLSMHYFAYASNQLVHGRDAGIITETSTYVKSSPDEKSTNLFMLHEGTRIEVTDSIAGWKQIRIANGNVGWMEERAMEEI